MHMYKSIKNFLFDQNYFINLWDNYLHIYQFIDIVTLNENLISLIMEKFKIEVKGHNFRILKLTKNEILIQGNIDEMRFF